MSNHEERNTIVDLVVGGVVGGASDAILGRVIGDLTQHKDIIIPYGPPESFSGLAYNDAIVLGVSALLAYYGYRSDNKSLMWGGLGAFIMELGQEIGEALYQNIPPITPPA